MITTIATGADRTEPLQETPRIWMYDEMKLLTWVVLVTQLLSQYWSENGTKQWPISCQVTYYAS